MYLITANKVTKSFPKTVQMGGQKIPHKAGWGEMPCEGENLGVNPNRHEFRVREMLVETRINVCYDKRFLK